MSAPPVRILGVFFPKQIYLFPDTGSDHTKHMNTYLDDIACLQQPNKDLDGLTQNVNESTEHTLSNLELCSQAHFCR